MPVITPEAWVKYVSVAATSHQAGADKKYISSVGGDYKIITAKDLLSGKSKTPLNEIVETTVKIFDELRDSFSKQEISMEVYENSLTTLQKCTKILIESRELKRNQIGDRFLRGMAYVIAYVSSLIFRHHQPLANLKAIDKMEIFCKLKVLNTNLYKQSLANWISNKKIPIKQLNLSEKEMLEIAPWLTYLDLTDVNIWSGKKCTFTEDFIGKLLENSQNLKSLFIENSKLEGSTFSHFKGMLNLQHLTISHCLFFNQKLEGLQNLQQLTISNCKDFNQKLEGMQNLQQLKISYCHSFNEKLEGMQNLKHLKISYCHDFNQKLKGMHKLKQLKIAHCNAFNHKLEGLQNLQQLEISSCYAFKIDHFETALLICKFLPALFKELIGKLTGESKKQLASALLENSKEIEKLAQNSPERIIDLIQGVEISEEEFLKRYPQYHPQMTLTKINQLVKQGESSEVVLTQFSSLKDQENYLEYLQLTLKSFPRLTSFLIQNLKEELIKDIKEHNITLENLPQESRMALLPLFSPDEIQKIVLGIPLEERKKLLQQLLQFEQFSGTTEAVLKEIKKTNLDQAKPTDLDNLLIPLKELFQKIPLQTVAAFASFEGNTEVLMAYCFVMGEPQMAVAIPCVAEKKLLGHLETQPLKKHKDVLFYATSKQKEAYVAQDLLKYQPIQAWESHKAEIEKQINLFKADKTSENYKKLEELWGKILLPTNTAVQEYTYILKSLEKVLLKFAPSENYTETVQKYIKAKMEQAKKIEGELKGTGSKIAKLAKEIPGKVEIPEEFIDEITGILMTNPYKDNHGKTLDKSTWDQLTKNPFTNEPMSQTPIAPHTDLKMKIEAFGEKHPEIILFFKDEP